MKKLNYAVVGATGLVGRKIISELEKSFIEVNSVKFLASPNSAGKKIKFNNEDIVVEEAKIENFKDVDVAFFSAGSEVSSKLIPQLIEKGIYVIDNTSYFRMNEKVPLIVPEVNFDSFKKYDTTLISNPNCSTIQMTVALKPLHDKYKLKKVLVSTYQAVSGSGEAAIKELKAQAKEFANNENISEAKILPVKSDKKHHQIFNNVIPQIDKFNVENGFTLEELKMMNETKKILEIKDLDIVATCIRVPVVNSHSETVTAEFEQEINLNEVKKMLSEFDGIVLMDDIENQVYPMPIKANDSSKVFVGRLRIDPINKKVLHMFIVSDNLLKGAASNSVQIAEKLLKGNII